MDCRGERANNQTLHKIIYSPISMSCSIITSNYETHKWILYSNFSTALKSSCFYSHISVLHYYFYTTFTFMYCTIWFPDAHTVLANIYINEKEACCRLAKLLIPQITILGHKGLVIQNPGVLLLVGGGNKKWHLHMIIVHQKSTEEIRKNAIHGKTDRVKLI